MVGGTRPRSGGASDATARSALTTPLDVVEEQLGQESRDVMEVLLSAHATHLLDGMMAGLGVMIVGPSGCGKTTLLRAFYDLDGQVYRSEDLTSASFVSHDASRSAEELEEIDLLPRIRHKTLVCADMAPWFQGPEEVIGKKWGVFASVMDGDGYSRDSGSHGNRGYEGDYRFNFLGATTPIPPRGHRVMAHVGNRLLFTWMDGDSKSDREQTEEVILGDDYEAKVDACNKATRFYLGEVWDHYGGHAAVEWERDPSNEVLDAITYLAKLLRYARAPLVDGDPQREGAKRPVSMLYDLARGHALLAGREKVLMDDVEISARAALDTIPHKRRGVVKALVDPETGSTMDTDDVAIEADVSLPTARERMKELDKLGIARHLPPKGEQDPHTVMLRAEFEWPDEIPYNG